MTDSLDEPVSLYPRVWLWETEDHLGVAGNETEAARAAAECIGATGTAVVEFARITTGPDMLLTYDRTGIGLEGTTVNGRVSWAPLTRAA
jgi:hypothetical protein